MYFLFSSQPEAIFAVPALSFFNFFFFVRRGRFLKCGMIKTKNISNSPSLQFSSTFSFSSFIFFFHKKNQKHSYAQKGKRGEKNHREDTKEEG